MHHWATTVSSFSPLKTIRFPPRVQTNRLHLFALTLVPAYAPAAEVALSPPAISVKNVRLTTLKTDAGDSIVQITLANLRALASPSYAFTSPHGSAAHIAGHRSPRQPPVDANQHHLSSRRKHQEVEYEHYTSSVLSGPHEVVVRAVGGGGVRTTEPGKVFRLMPGDDARVDVGVTFDSDATSSSGVGSVMLGALENVGKTLGLPTSFLRMLGGPKDDIEVEVLVISTTTNTPIVKSSGWDLDLSFSGASEGTWEATRESLAKHETPRWVSLPSIGGVGFIDFLSSGITRSLEFCEFGSTVSTTA